MCLWLCEGKPSSIFIFMTSLYKGVICGNRKQPVSLLVHLEQRNFVSDSRSWKIYLVGRNKPAWITNQTVSQTWYNLSNVIVVNKNFSFAKCMRCFHKSDAIVFSKLYISCIWFHFSSTNSPLIAPVSNNMIYLNMLFIPELPCTACSTDILRNK